MSDEPVTPPAFVLFGTLVTLAALGVREHYLLSAVVAAPIRGDIVQYVDYAMNLHLHGVFSMSPPGGTPVPDAFRNPGYPAMLSLLMAGTTAPDEWYWRVLHLQAVLGAATAALAIVLARPWLSRPAALATGAGVALWPHSIAFAGTLLSETLLAFLLVLSLVLIARALRRNSPSLAVGGGIALAAAYLVNPLALGLVPVVAAVAWPASRRVLTGLVAIPLLACTLWTARNAGLPDAPGPGRAVINFVQGSWPDFHVAWALRQSDPVARDIMQEIDSEAAQLEREPIAGLARIGSRISSAPTAYLRWYAFEKPWLLWDWNVRVGAGDIYFLEVERSPLEGAGVLGLEKSAARWLNPWIFGAAAFACVGILAIWLQRRRPDPAAVLVSACTLALTAAHVLLQAEPRYSVAYRPLELLLAVAFVAGIAAWARARRQATI